MSTRILIVMGLIVLLSLATVLPGCSDGDAAQASNAEATEGEPAKNSDDADDESAKGKKNGDGDDKKKKEEAVPVEIAELTVGPIESVLRFSTNLEAEDQVQVFSQAKRLVTRLLVEEGDRVRKGQVLLRLQDDEQRSALTKVRTQLEKAEREYKRKQRLYDQQMISEQEFNEATYEIDQLRIELEDAQRELSYTEVRAPITGTITARLINLGDQVQIGQHLFDIVDFDSLVARVFVPERHLPELRRGLTARLSSRATLGREYAGSVERIAPIVDPKTGTIKVTIDVGGQRGLRPGMYVDVDLVTATHADAVLVPKRAVVHDNDQMFVFRLADERRVERVFIEPRLSDKLHVEPAGGLQAGDRVIVAGQAGLKDGALVKLPGDSDEQADGEAPGAVEQASL